MGKRIDKLVLSALIIAAFYLFYANALGSPGASALLTSFSLYLLNAFWAGFSNQWQSSRFSKKRRARRLAAGVIEKWIFLPADEAKKALIGLLESAYPNQLENCAVCLLQRSENILSADDILSIWRKHAADEKIVIAATANFSDRVRQSAAALKRPTVCLLGKDQLAALQALHGKLPENTPPAPKKARFSITTDRKKAPRQLAIGLGLFLSYWINGKWLYLAVSIALFFLAALGFHQKAAPKRLFS